jgi:L-ascorbate metabolism protein UlaG (beta-lactamase superfamily)
MRLEASLLGCLCILLIFAQAGAQFSADTIKTAKGDLKITFLGHASLLFEYGGKAVYADPAAAADYAKLPKADIILITHEHSDHLNPGNIKTLSKQGTVVIANRAAQLQGAVVMKNGDTRTEMEFPIEAVPAYNIVRSQYHPKGNGNGYVITFGDKRIYIAADTENIPEMKALKNIEIAFLPMNLPYTMTPENVVDAVKLFKPKILYIYHYRGSDTEKLQTLMKDVPGVELRIRKMY